MHYNILSPNFSKFNEKRISQKITLYEAHSTDYQPVNILKGLKIT